MTDRDDLADVLEPAEHIHAALQGLADGPLAESIAARDAARPLGNLVRSGAGTSMALAADHMLAWRNLYVRGRVVPTFAHMTLLRSVIEGASTTRWLVQASATSSTRVARGIGAALADLEERGKVERLAAPETLSRGRRGKSAADRITDMRASAAAAGQSIETRGHTWLAEHHGPGAATYRVLCAFAHGGQAITLAASDATKRDAVDSDDLRAVLLEPNREGTMLMSRTAVAHAQAALVALYLYYGRSLAD